MTNLISELLELNKNGRNQRRVDEIEEEIASSIDDYINENDFFNLSTNEISKIVGKSGTDDADLICDIISKINERKNEGETMLFMEMFDPEEIELDGCIKILSTLNKFPICRKTRRKFIENKKIIKIDYKYEIEKRDKEINELERRLKYEPTPKPVDFESDINRASEEGKLTSIKYIFEQNCKKNS